MLKVELFDITTNKADQREAEMALTPEQRVSLCLDLIELNASLSHNQHIPADDQIEWIELFFKNE